MSNLQVCRLYWHPTLTIDGQGSQAFPALHSRSYLSTPLKIPGAGYSNEGLRAAGVQHLDLLVRPAFASHPLYKGTQLEKRVEGLCSPEHDESFLLPIGANSAVSREWNGGPPQASLLGEHMGEFRRVIATTARTSDEKLDRR